VWRGYRLVPAVIYLQVYVASRAGHCTLKVYGYNLRRCAPTVGYVLSCGGAYRVYPCLRIIVVGYDDKRELECCGIDGSILIYCSEVYSVRADAEAGDGEWQCYSLVPAVIYLQVYVASPL
jgi:hypothetical protein